MKKKEEEVTSNNNNNKQNIHITSAQILYSRCLAKLIDLNKYPDCAKLG